MSPQARRQEQVMGIGGWIWLGLIVGGLLISLRWMPDAARSVRAEFNDASPGGKIAAVMLVPVLLFLLAFVVLAPMALLGGLVKEERPDGCYRQVTEWNAATKTNQTDYEPVPCPEQVVP